MLWSFSFSILHIFKTYFPCLRTAMPLLSSQKYVRVPAESSSAHCLLSMALFHGFNYFLKGYNNKGFPELWLSLSLRKECDTYHIYWHHSDSPAADTIFKFWPANWNQTLDGVAPSAAKVLHSLPSPSRGWPASSLPFMTACQGSAGTAMLSLLFLFQQSVFVELYELLEGTL